MDESNIDLSCCRYVVIPGDWCVTTCPDPYYLVTITQTFTHDCRQRGTLIWKITIIIIIALIPLVLLERDDVTEQICPGYLITYNCSSVVHENTAPSLVWEVIVLGELAQSIIYSESSAIGVMSEVRNFMTILTEYTAGGHTRSTLTLIVNSQYDIYEADVSCTFGSLSPATDSIQRQFIHEGDDES